MRSQADLPGAIVTGGAGFVGSHLCEVLLSRGWSVTAVDNFATGSPRNVAHLTGHPHFRLVEHDVATSPMSVSGPSALVFHLASPASPRDYQRLSLETLDAGSAGTRNALELAHLHDARFVLASTSEVYGEPLVHPQTESYWGNVNPVGPRSMYDESKRFAEALTVAFAARHGLDWSIARIFNCYGPRMQPNDGRAIPTFIWQSLHRRPLTVAGDGSHTRSPCYVDDVVDALLRLGRSKVNGPVNIGNPEEIRVLDLARRIALLAGGPGEIEFFPRTADDPSRRCPDISMARTELDWKPLVGLDEGLMATIEWFKTLLASSRGDTASLVLNRQDQADSIRGTG